MPVRLIRDGRPLPDPEDADPRGLVAVGGDLRPARLLEAYRRGIFPWYGEGLPILWHSPDPRFVLEPGDLRVNRSLRKTLRRQPYRVTLDTAFSAVIQHCAAVPRPDQDGTWITRDMVLAYERLYELGHAHSVEAWLGERLVGGLYGVAIGAIFCGESMFTLAPDASKVAFVSLTRQLEAWGFALIDCQVHTEHLERFGAVEWPRRRFLDVLERERSRKVRAPEGRWQFEAAINDAERG